MKYKTLVVSEPDALGYHHDVGYILYSPNNREVEEFYTICPFFGGQMALNMDRMNEYQKARLQKYLDKKLAEQDESYKDNGGGDAA